MNTSIHHPYIDLRGSTTLDNLEKMRYQTQM
jgi:hypothetical protein